MSTLLLSDLHLPTGPSPLRDRFLALLAGPARGADAVYLLGDLFEYWIGDDVGLREYAPECEAIRELVAAGVPVFVQRGNRDFLIGERFCRATGAERLDDPCVVDLHGTPTLLSHGDIWCTDDLGYQRWRSFSRQPLTQWLFTRLPQRLREGIAGGVRARSSTSKARKPIDIMDVNPVAIADAFIEFGVNRMIHGHTHRPDTHRPSVDGIERERIVLPDWRPQRMEYLSVDARSCTLQDAGA